MHIRTFFFALLFFSNQILFAQDAQTVTWGSPTTQDIGTVRMHSSKTVVFPFKNVSDRPIVIENVRTTCGCTVADWGQDAILPGESAEIKIEYTANKVGGVRKKIKVFFDAQRKPELLYIEGEVTE